MYDAPEEYVSATIICKSEGATTTTYTLTFPDENQDNNKVSSYTKPWTAKIGDNSWTIANFNNNNWSSSWKYVKCGNKTAVSVASITTDWAIEEAITKVTVTIDKITAGSVNSIKLQVSTDDSFATDSIVEEIDITKSQGDKVCTMTTPTANCYYKLVFDCAKGSANGFVQVSKVVYTNE